MFLKWRKIRIIKLLRLRKILLQLRHRSIRVRRVVGEILGSLIHRVLIGSIMIFIVIGMVIKVVIIMVIMVIIKI